jgi:hypothetical protein
MKWPLVFQSSQDISVTPYSIQHSCMWTHCHTVRSGGRGFYLIRGMSRGGRAGNQGESGAPRPSTQKQEGSRQLESKKRIQDKYRLRVEVGCCRWYWQVRSWHICPLEWIAEVVSYTRGDASPLFFPSSPRPFAMGLPFAMFQYKKTGLNRCTPLHPWSWTFQPPDPWAK